MDIRNGKRRGPGLKPGLNMADTGSVVGRATSSVLTGRSRACTPTGRGSSANNMVAANAALKRRA